VFIYFFFPETYGKSLEELAFLFEGAEKQAELTASGQKVLDDPGVTEIHEHSEQKA